MIRKTKIIKKNFYQNSGNKNNITSRNQLQCSWLFFGSGGLDMNGHHGSIATISTYPHAAGGGVSCEESGKALQYVRMY